MSPSMLMRLVREFGAELALLVASIRSFVESNAELQEGNDLVTRARNAGTVISVVVIGIVALVGILIFGEVYEAMPDTGTQLDATADDILEGFGDAMGLVPIILLVLLASIVIAVVQRMRR